MNYAHTSSGLSSPHRIKSAFALLQAEVEMQLGKEAGASFGRIAGDYEEALCAQSEGQFSMDFVEVDGDKIPA